MPSIVFCLKYDKFKLQLQGKSQIYVNALVFNVHIIVSVGTWNLYSGHST